MTNRISILHVEDDPNDVLLLQRATRKANLSVELNSVGDGDRAVAYLNGLEEFADREKFPLPQVVLLDLKMPRKNGLEVLTWIRSQPSLRRVVVVIFTSSRHDEDINRAYEIGANSYLVKPVGFDALIGMVKLMHDYWLGINEKPQV